MADFLYFPVRMGKWNWLSRSALASPLISCISQRAMNLLTDSEWTGNVRDLENNIESIFVINSPEVIDLQHLPQGIREEISVVPHSCWGLIFGRFIPRWRA
jgi:DNA-binding NtrC family response regulator